MIPDNNRRLFGLAVHRRYSELDCLQNVCAGFDFLFVRMRFFRADITNVEAEVDV